MLAMSLTELSQALEDNPTWLAHLSATNELSNWELFEKRLVLMQNFNKIVEMSAEDFFKHIITGSRTEMYDELLESGLTEDEDKILHSKGANALLELPSEKFFAAMQKDGLAERWTDMLYLNGDDDFIRRLMEKNKEMDFMYFDETRKNMYHFLKKRIHLLKHPDGILSWARENEKRARGIADLRNDDEALRRYLVMNEHQMKFLQLWRMTQIQILREANSNPHNHLATQSSRGVGQGRSRSTSYGRRRGIAPKSSSKVSKSTSELEPLSEFLLREPRGFAAKPLTKTSKSVHTDDVSFRRSIGHLKFAKE